MLKCLYAACASLSIFVSQLAATDFKPWYKHIYSLDFRGQVFLQQFQQIDMRCGKVKRCEIDAFYEISALAVPKENWTAEIEFLASDTRYRAFGLNALRLTGRYFWLNDVVGDPVSLATGITASKIFEASRRNIAIFDHGGLACEGHIAVGKEISCEQFWTSRAWGVLGVGIADVGSPWLRANLVWERNWWELHRLKVFTETIWGFGHNDLSRCHFPGYGSIRYQAIDVGIHYGYRLFDETLLSIGYAHRVYGRNCPIQVNFVTFEICYPSNF